ncbi:MAG TPA: type II toxin-antitoxin system VapC family toxin [Accumulibacter sp.]|uniref:type II toxin-antitoxin system VapC family toxin n=1 Tax=Accumulibacter sp. TaxID=2053492 RepID=UPI0025D16281|nr:type II toxin-antitoxin system VapC family toxin [Accumulibacter sp.]MCM8598757.1 type II toxin-antitoxin system VapC family toxin [Accumulibacter sp.]MCM8662751.1 type II toxin-antitoxin system VapC family toxin [Accumulibacter sp.]HNC53239.1 type II toxin-antitoxin system VapC family toxin [Accumulibacter sp.]
MSFVLDSSIALSWCFEDERTPATRALLVRVGVAGACAPALWPLEVLNALAMAERRSRIDSERRQRLAGFLHDLPVTIDDETASQAWAVASQLAARFRLTVYDAAYLELAQRLNLPLATLDQELRAAAAALGVPLLGT